MLLSCTLLFLTLVFAAYNSERCHKNPIKTTVSPTKCVAGRRLYENWSFYKIPGNESELRTPPSWLAAIATNYAGIKTFCSGVLINDRYVLTAQRCVLPPLEPQHVNVTLSAGEYPVSELIHHADFDQSDPKTSHNDVALLKLATILRFTRKLLPLQLVADGDVSELSTSTFGVSQNGGINHFVELKGVLWQTNACKRFNQYYDYFVATEELLCSKIDSGGDCFNLNSMSGAALTMEKQKRIYKIDVLIGILSWWWPKQRPCAAQDNPFVFVNVHSKLPWIVNKTTDAQYCRY